MTFDEIPNGSPLTVESFCRVAMEVITELNHELSRGNGAPEWAALEAFSMWLKDSIRMMMAPDPNSARELTIWKMWRTELIPTVTLDQWKAGLCKARNQLNAFFAKAFGSSWGTFLTIDEIINEVNVLPSAKWLVKNQRGSYDLDPHALRDALRKGRGLEPVRRKGSLRGKNRATFVRPPEKSTNPSDLIANGELALDNLADNSDSPEWRLLAEEDRERLDVLKSLCEERGRMPARSKDTRAARLYLLKLASGEDISKIDAARQLGSDPGNLTRALDREVRAICEHPLIRRYLPPNNS
jgi:hypothetical protein